MPNISKIKSNNEKGFTLLELLLYIGVVGFIVLSVSMLFSLLVQARVSNQAVIEVEQQGLEALDIISYELRHAEDINIPQEGQTSGELDIDSVIDDRNIVFSQAENRIQMEVDGGDPVFLTNSRVEVIDMEFQNTSASSRYEGVVVEFTLQHINTEDRKEYDYQKTFKTGASLRPHDR